jgi:translation initiation factor 2B subunit (eIF-2B alpha/beta/delta family)
MIDSTMPDLQQEREHLAQADQHIVDGEKRVAEQMALIKRMTEQGQDTSLTQDFLQNLEQTLEQWHAHRQLILDRIAQG